MSILASFAPAAAAALLTPSGSGEGYYLCGDFVRWDGGYHASAITRFEVGSEGQRTNEYRFTWRPDPSDTSLVALEWSWLPLAVDSLPPPDHISFGIRTPRSLKGGTILLIPAEGELLPLSVAKPAVTYSKSSGRVEVRITDPAQLARLIERGGWRFAAIDSKGKVAAQGPIKLPDRAGMEIRYRPLAESLRAKAAAYETACTFEPQTETR